MFHDHQQGDDLEDNGGEETLSGKGGMQEANDVITVMLGRGRPAKECPP